MVNTVPDPALPQPGYGTGPVLPTCVPRINNRSNSLPASSGSRPLLRKSSGLTPVKREPSLSRDSFLEFRQGDTCHIISETYAYKTESYYHILRHELDGRKVKPSSSAVLDASVVPLCLERARLAGIPVCDWGISQGYVPIPSILYGLNYFSSTAAYCVADDEKQAKEAVRHLTNCGKYPFCYQKLSKGATISSCISVFGRTAGGCGSIENLARQVYDLFAIPLVTMVFVSDGDSYRLSSLSPTKYSRLSPKERSLLQAYLNHQGFL